MQNQFFVKLIPSRPTFHLDMTPEEAALMQAHAHYWAALMKRGVVHVFGPVLDQDGVYGMGVISAKSIEEAQTLISDDPAVPLMTVKVSPMQAIMPS